MTAAREKIDGVLRHLRQREEKQRQAAGAWERSKENCLRIAKALLDGTGVGARLDENTVILEARNGARAGFVFDPQQLALVGLRWKAGEKAPVGAMASFFSLKIEPPARSQGHAPGQWGPSRPEGIGDLSARMDSQQAFEKAIADWFEWAHMGDGAPPAGA